MLGVASKDLGSATAETVQIDRRQFNTPCSHSAAMVRVGSEGEIDRIRGHCCRVHAVQRPARKPPQQKARHGQQPLPCCETACAYALVPLWALVVFEAWAFDNRHRAIAVIVLAGVAIVPEFVLIPLRIKRSRRRRGQRSA